MRLSASIAMTFCASMGTMERIGRTTLSLAVWNVHAAGGHDLPASRVVSIPVAVPMNPSVAPATAIDHADSLGRILSVRVFDVGVRAPVVDLGANGGRMT